jgi:hypothetical protein
MLDDFKKLNGDIQELTEVTLLPLIQGTAKLESFQYNPAEWPASSRKLSDKVFCNVGLSKTTFKAMTFKNCFFEDCLFIGSTFDQVEFHRCTFKDCNFYKADFNRCYIDPSSFKFHDAYKASDSNMGVSLFQGLLENSSVMHQAQFGMTADIRFRQWKRAQLSYDGKIGKIGRWKMVYDWLSSLVYEYTSGFGYKPLRFFGFTVLLFAIVSVGNFVFLRHQITVGSGPNTLSSFSDAVFYSFSILTVLGFSSITPTSGAAKIVAVSEALAAIGWLSIYTSLVVKRFVR